ISQILLHFLRFCGSIIEVIKVLADGGRVAVNQLYVFVLVTLFFKHVERRATLARASWSARPFDGSLDRQRLPRVANGLQNATDRILTAGEISYVLSHDAAPDATEMCELRRGERRGGLVRWD